MKSKPTYPLAILFLAATALGEGCEPEESMAPPLDEKPVEEKPLYEARATAGHVYTPSSWGITQECMRTSDLGDFLDGYDWDEMDLANRNKVESIVYWSRVRPTPRHLQSWLCVNGEDWKPTPLPLDPREPRPPGVKE